MKMRLFGVLMLLVGLATGANAAQVGDFGTLTPTTIYPFGNSQTGSFTDDWYFKVGSGQQVGAYVASFNLGQVSDIANLAIAIVQNPGGAESTVVSQNAITNGLVDMAVINASGLTGGTQYALRLTGNTVSVGAGMYTGALSSTLSPVPIPSSVLLMGSALGGLFCVGRRKKEA